MWRVSATRAASISRAVNQPRWDVHEVLVEQQVLARLGGVRFLHARDVERLQLPRRARILARPGSGSVGRELILTLGGGEPTGEAPP